MIDLNRQSGTSPTGWVPNISGDLLINSSTIPAERASPKDVSPQREELAPEGAEGADSPYIQQPTEEVPAPTKDLSEPGSTKSTGEEAHLPGNPPENQAGNQVDMMDIDTDMSTAVTRPQRERQRYDPYRFDNAFGSAGTAFIATANSDPLTYKQAMNSPDAFRWKESITTEFDNLSLSYLKP